ncbi:MAG: hypothetical protein GC166_09870 [Alphaproteobacteria bacterium]|nr:hypothetical protein [Alphaproteobacteria bacterium]
MTMKDRRAAARRMMARRPFLAGMIGVTGAIVLGGGVYEAARMMSYGRRHNTQYDDLLDLLDDRHEAGRIGRAVLEDAQFEPWTAAPQLRNRIAEHGDLAGAIEDDAEQARLVEVNGWMLPETLALLCALSAVMG